MKAPYFPSSKPNFPLEQVGHFLLGSPFLVKSSLGKNKSESSFSRASRILSLSNSDILFKCGLNPSQNSSNNFL